MSKKVEKRRRMKEQRGEGGDAKWLLTLLRSDYLGGEEGGRCSMFCVFELGQSVYAAPSVVGCTQSALQHKHLPLMNDPLQNNKGVASLKRRR